MNPNPITTPGDMVTLSELKAHLRVTHNQEDELYRTYLGAAVDRIETQTGQTFITRQFEWTLPCFSAELELPHAPFVTLDQIDYYDEDDAAQTVTLGDVYVDDDITATISNTTDDGWPATYVREDAVKLTFTAGYGTTPSSVPEKARLCAMMLVAHFDRNREAVITGTIVTIFPQAVDSLLRSMSIGRYAGQA